MIVSRRRDLALTVIDVKTKILGDSNDVETKTSQDWKILWMLRLSLVDTMQNMWIARLY